MAETSDAERDETEILGALDDASSTFLKRTLQISVARAHLTDKRSKDDTVEQLLDVVKGLVK